MVEFEKTKIRMLDKLLREICNSTVRKMDWDKIERNDISFRQKVREVFRFDSEDGWIFLISSLDVISDTQIAITHFLNNRINNGGIGYNIGERYLKLYGILSAVYIQKNAFLKLCELFKVENKSLIQRDLNALAIVFLRHSISAHPTNFASDSGVTAFKIDRISVSDEGKISIRDANNKVEIFNLFDCIFDYQSKVEDLFRKILEKQLRLVTNPL